MTSTLGCVFFVGGCEFFHEPSKHLRRLGIVPVVIYEIETTAGEHFPHGRGSEVMQSRFDMLDAEQVEGLIRITEYSAIKGVDEEGDFFQVTPYDKVPGQSDGFEVQIESVCDKEIQNTEGNGEPFAAGNDLVDETVFRVGVVLGIAPEAPFVKEHAVDDAATLARGSGLDGELAAALGDFVDGSLAGADIELRVDRARKQQNA